jgi:hypothetical protein
MFLPVPAAPRPVWLSTRGYVAVWLMPGAGLCAPPLPHETMTRLDSPISSRDISTTMALINEAIIDLKSCGKGEQSSLRDR